MALVSDPPRPDRDQGVFETLLVIDEHPVELDAHLARITASLEALFPDRPPPDLSQIDVPVVDLPYGWSTTGTSTGCRGEGALGMRVTVAPDRFGALEVDVSLRAVDRALAFEPPVALRSLPLAGGLGAHKWTDRSLLDAAQARLPADALPLVVDADGTVLEASRANVFAMRDGALFTPPLDGRILPGVTRMRVLEIAARMEIKAHEEKLVWTDLLAANEVFLTGSIRGIERVRSLDGTALGVAGGVAAELGVQLRRTWTAAKVG
jgi:para-aminobenzoate synthetase/4-amino-4-deoxychorismate lyase